MSVVSAAANLMFFKIKIGDSRDGSASGERLTSVCHKPVIQGPKSMGTAEIAQAGACGSAGFFL
jgi:hypothetical protein